MLFLFNSTFNLLAFGAALLVALIADHYLGEPPTCLHPVVWTGNYLNWASKRLQPKALPVVQDLKSFWLAACFWCLGAAVVLVVACAVQWVAFQLPWYLAAMLLGLALKPMLQVEKWASRAALEAMVFDDTWGKPQPIPSENSF